MKKLLALSFLAISALAQTASVTRPVPLGITDLTVSGTWACAPAPHSFTIQIATNGTPDQFEWSEDNGSLSGAINITGSAQLLTCGMSVSFGGTTGHVVGGQAVFEVYVPGAMSQTFVQQGFGAATRNAQEKIREVLSVGDFVHPLAPGSAYADFQNALNEAAWRGGGTIEISAGKYQLAQDITIPCGVLLRGPVVNGKFGAVVTRAGGATIHIQGCQQVAFGAGQGGIQDLYISGPTQGVLGKAITLDDGALGFAMKNLIVENADWAVWANSTVSAVGNMYSENVRCGGHVTYCNWMQITGSTPGAGFNEMNTWLNPGIRCPGNPWVANTVYSAGQFVTDTYSHVQQITSTGTGGATVPTWVQPWLPSTAYALNATIVDPAGNLQKATTAGTSGPIRPAVNNYGIGISNPFGTTSGSTALDGTVVWTYQAPNTTSDGGATFTDQGQAACFVFKGDGANSKALVSHLVINPDASFAGNSQVSPPWYGTIFDLYATASFTLIGGEINYADLLIHMDQYSHNLYVTGTTLVASETAGNTRLGIQLDSGSTRVAEIHAANGGDINWPYTEKFYNQAINTTLSAGTTANSSPQTFGVISAVSFKLMNTLVLIPGNWIAAYSYFTGEIFTDLAGHNQKVTACPVLPTQCISGQVAPLFNDSGGTTIDGTATLTDQGTGNQESIYSAFVDPTHLQGILANNHAANETVQLPAYSSLNLLSSKLVAPAAMSAIDIESQQPSITLNSNVPGLGDAGFRLGTGILGSQSWSCASDPIGVANRFACFRGWVPPAGVTPVRSWSLDYDPGRNLTDMWAEGNVTAGHDLRATGNAVPVTNAVSSLGTSGFQWHALYLDSGGTLFLGGAAQNYITALTGDVIATPSAPGSTVATLPATGVSAGTYTSLTVDSKGRVTAGSNPGSAVTGATGSQSCSGANPHITGVSLGLVGTVVTLSATCGP